VTIHAAPTPSLNSLVRAIVGVRQPRCVPWLGSKGPERSVRFYSRGRWAIYGGVRRSLERRGKTDGVVWLPDYLCSEAVTQLRRPELSLYYYPIQGDLSPDWDAINSQSAGSCPPDIFVLVHYFGFHNCIGEAKAFCARHNADLLEDCAHLLIPASGCGETTAVFCPHKFLPLPEGSLLTFAREPNVSNTDQIFESDKTSILSWMAARLAQRLMLSIGMSWDGFRQRSSPTSRPGGTDKQTARPRMVPDKYALKLLGVLEADLGRVFRQRRKHYSLLAQAIAGVDYVEPLFATLPDSACPYVFPMLVQNGRDGLDARLRDCGVPSSDWPNLPAEVTKHPRAHKIAIWMQQHILVLPVHQDLSGKQMDYLTLTLKRLLGERAG